MNEKPTMLLVLGVHRSGTSTVARLLECLGATHSKKILPIHITNPKGFFEDSDIYLFHENELMPALGMVWHDIAPPDWKMIGPEERSDFLKKAKGILLENFSHSNALSVIKEPRITLLLPFWLEVFGMAGFNVKAVCVVRDPLSVARSLRARSRDFSITKGSAIYTSNWLSALPFLKGVEASFISYDSLFSDARAVLVSLSQELGIPLPSDFDRRVDVFLDEFLDQDLRHSVVTSHELDAEPELLPASLVVHRSLVKANGDTFFHGMPDDITHQVRWFYESAPILRDYDRVFKQNLELFRKLEHNKKSMLGNWGPGISDGAGRLKKSLLSACSSIRSLIWRRSPS
ncbi:MAG: hypothetical protein EBZ67_12015 [Chitinophagia bacterium]|nr:hypothetical protein [Chitinophagia bacterium]